jgi:hypothetical protein
VKLRIDEFSRENRPFGTYVTIEATVDNFPARTAHPQPTSLVQLASFLLAGPSAAIPW